MAGRGISFWRDLAIARVKAEPKRAAFLTVLVAIMALMWIKTLTNGGVSPLAARASIDSSALAATAGTSEKPLVSRTSQALLEWTRSPLPLVHRNVFDIKLEYFPQDQSSPPPLAAQGPEGFWEEVAKSLSSRADQEKARRILADNLRVQAARLDLQSTVMSQGSPKALINGVLVGEGDVVSGFRIAKIQARGVIVEREGVKLEVLFSFR